ncbi:MAG: hypothetical protein SGILL_000368 [Bacillariaceae sp.]
MSNAQKLSEIIPSHNNNNNGKAAVPPNSNNGGGNTTDGDDGSKSDGGASHAVEDEVVCNTMSGMDYNHFGMHHLIRMWVSFALSRRSFSLLARASFIAAKSGISMDDVLANKSPFAAITNTPVMTWLSVNILCPREQQSTLGPRVKPQEIPRDVLSAFHINLESLVLNPDSFQRWLMIRWNHQGKSRFWASPFWERDFCSVEDMERIWVENKDEVIDLFLPKSEKKKFGKSFFKLIFLNKEPNAPVYATRTPMKVRPKGTKQTLDVTFINAFKIIDVDQSMHYHEIRLVDNMPTEDGSTTTTTTTTNATRTANAAMSSSSQARKPSVTSSTLAELLASDIPTKKRDRGSFSNQNIDINSDPLLDGDLELTDLEMTDELEEWMNMLDDPFSSR